MVWEVNASALPITMYTGTLIALSPVLVKPLPDAGEMLKTARITPHALRSFPHSISSIHNPTLFSVRYWIMLTVISPVPRRTCPLFFLPRQAGTGHALP